VTAPTPARTADEPEVVVVADLEAAAAEAAQRIAAILADAVTSRGRADWATTGGSAATPIYRRLAAAQLRDIVPWQDIHAWWGDDRFVPRDHPLSNVKPFDDILLAIGHTEEGQVGLAIGAAGPIPLSLDHYHPFPTGEAIGAGQDAAWCATRLAETLEATISERWDGIPVFDLIVVGVGADGHVLSVFPDSAAFESDALALAIPAPTHIEPHVERVTLNPRVLGAARHVIVVGAGAEKAQVLRDALNEDVDPRRLPVQLARGSNAVWILDQAAAARLDARREGVSPSGPVAPA
jgi:6-phosphogluconolactonase